MICSTTSSIQDKTVLKYHGLVNGTATLGESRTENLILGNTMIMSETRDKAMKEMASQAADLGANAILGVVFEHVSIWHGRNLLISVSGTAVAIE